MRIGSSQATGPRGHGVHTVAHSDRLQSEHRVEPPCADVHVKLMSILSTIGVRRLCGPNTGRPHAG